MIKEQKLSDIKLEKIQQSIHKLINNLVSGNKRKAIGDLIYIIDNSIKLKYILKAVLEEDN